MIRLGVHGLLARGEERPALESLGSRGIFDDPHEVRFVRSQGLMGSSVPHLLPGEQVPSPSTDAGLNPRLASATRMAAVLRALRCGCGVCLGAWSPAHSPPWSLRGPFLPAAAAESWPLGDWGASRLPAGAHMCSEVRVRRCELIPNPKGLFKKWKLTH